MAEEIKYVRLTPYNQVAGALCERFTVGGRTFTAGEWYTVGKSWANKIKDLKQGSGAPFFQIMGEEEFRDTARKELSAAMHAAGLAGLAMQGAVDMPKPKAVDSKKKTKSDFAGLDKATTEIDLSDADSPPASTAPTLSAADLDGMTKTEMVEAAGEYGIEVDAKSSKTRIRAVIEAELK